MCTCSVVSKMQVPVNTEEWFEHFVHVKQGMRSCCTIDYAPRREILENLGPYRAKTNVDA